MVHSATMFSGLLKSAYVPKLAITLTITLIIVSSPIFISINPVADVLGSATSNTNKVDRSSYHTSPQVSDRSLPVLSSTIPTPIGPSTISQDGRGDVTIHPDLT